MHAYARASGSRMSDGDGGGHKLHDRGFYDRGSNVDRSNEDIDLSSNHRRSLSVSKRSRSPTQPLRLSSTGMESPSRESRYSCVPIRTVATECDGHVSNGRRSSCRSKSNNDDDDDDSGFNEEDYLAGRIFTGLVSNRLLVKISSPPLDTLFKPDISKQSDSQKRLRSASVNRIQDVVFKPNEQQSVRDKGERRNTLQHDAIYSKQINCNKSNSGTRLDQHGCTDIRAVRPGVNQTNNAGHAVCSAPRFCTETKEREEITKRMNSNNQNNLGRLKTGSLPNYSQGDRIGPSIKMANKLEEDKSDYEMHGRGRRSDRSVRSIDENSKRKHRSSHETNPDDHVSLEINDTTSKAGKSSKDHSDDSEKDDTDKVYNYFLYIGTRIPSKSFSRLSRSVNRQTTNLVPS